MLGVVFISNFGVYDIMAIKTKDSYDYYVGSDINSLPLEFMYGTELFDINNFGYAIEAFHSKHFYDLEGDNNGK